MSTLNQGPGEKDARIQSILSKISKFEEQMSRLREELNECIAEEGDGPPKAIPSVLPDGLGDHMPDLDKASADLGSKKTQAEVLDALIEHASSFAPRAALFLIKGASLVLRTAKGFGDAGGQLRGLQVSLELDTLLRHIAQTKASYQGSAYAQSQNGELAEKLDLAPDEIVAGAPLLIFGKVAGVIYADTDGRQGSVKLDALEMLAIAAGSKLESLAAGQRAAAKPPQSVPAQAPAAAPPAAPAPPPQSKPPDSPRSIGSLGLTLPPGSASAEALSEMEKAHHEAIRIAKILVQEIVLYNGTALESGRMNGDIYGRVRADLDRSREMYERRIDLSVIRYRDYLHDEIVRVLCNGDAARLGSDYPGPIQPPN